MDPISDKSIAEVVRIMAIEGIGEEEIEQQVLDLVGESMVARRLIDWIPEAFGLVAVAHSKAVFTPKFHARRESGKYCSFAYSAEPIVVIAMRLGAELLHRDQSLFFNIAIRGSVMDSIRKAKEANMPIEGAVFSGPVLLGIPAEVYLGSRGSFWSRLFSR